MDDAKTWIASSLNGLSGKTLVLSQITVYGEALYAPAADGLLYRSDNGTDWSIVGEAPEIKGYYEDEERTKEAIVELDGVRYYNSGDIGFLDEAGFLTITDRLSRFAKIGGEMISLGAVEAQISSVLGDEVTFVCTNVADEKKGEQVVMLFSGEISEEEVAARIRASAIPSIMQPSKIYKVEAVPVLGTGKVDFKSNKKLAAQLVAGEGNLGAAEEA